ncbi:GH3 auxin-responsive promoter [compost metagenome]
MIYKMMLQGGGIVEKKFNSSTENYSKVNNELLFKILKNNSKSEFGIKYNFKSIKSIKVFKDKVKLSEYKDYESYINRMADGEKNVLVSEDVVYFSHTSGTTGKQKLIPCTKSSRKVAAKYMALLINKFTYNNFKDTWKLDKGLMIADIVMTTYTEGGVPICSATSGGIKSIKPLLPFLYTSPIEVMEIKDKETAYYLHLLFALEESRLSYINGIFISNILDLLRILEEKHQDLVNDIRKGRINNNLNIDKTISEKLNKLIAPNSTRADELEKEFKIGFEGIAKRIWPRLSYIATVTGANFSIYDDKVNHYTDSIPIYSPVYAASEAMIGINPYADKIRYVIVPDTAFYEFIHIKDGEAESRDTFSLDEIRLGEKYEIVVTNYAGFYRYRIGDIIKVVGFYNGCPEVEFVCRKNQLLNMVSEKTNEEHITNSIKRTMKYLNLSLVDYTTLPDNSITPGRYIFYCEFKNDISISTVRLLEEKLDKEIRNSNLAYDRARNTNRLGKVKVIILAPKTFNSVKQYLFNKGISKNQIKIPRVITNNTSILNILKRNRRL